MGRAFIIIISINYVMLLDGGIIIFIMFPSRKYRDFQMGRTYYILNYNILCFATLQISSRLLAEPRVNKTEINKKINEN